MQDAVHDTSEERAREAALRWLARRPLTVAELRSRLMTDGHATDCVEATLDRLREAGYLGDAALARHFIVVRSERSGYGPQRLIGDLVRRGVDRSVALAAWDDAVEAGEIDPDRSLRRQIGRRLGRGSGAVSRSDLRRVYTALLRAGFDESAVRRELQPFRQLSDPAINDGIDP